MTPSTLRLLSLCMFVTACGPLDPEEMAELDDTAEVESALTNIDSRCIGHLPSGKTTCIRLQKASNQQVRAYGAISGSSGTMAVEGVQLYVAGTLVAASGPIKGTGHVSSATGYKGPYKCKTQLQFCATFAWSGQPGYRMCEKYTACAGE
ncbi:MAG: hypothetical protein JNK82_13795 [Myxococcaceae bacterium]|nr:hypothetical protein [Myxococcaceae bacterium]